MGQMVLGVATRRWEGSEDCIQTWRDTASRSYPEFYAVNMTIPAAQNYIYKNTTEPIISLIHDDVKILEQNWDFRVLKEFDDPTVGMVGFGGALRHGAPDLYSSPYKLQNLGRFGFASNMREAEAHGARFAGERDCAVFDGFAIFIRRAILDKIGGFPMKSGYYLYCEAICCEARKQGYRLRQVGVACDHLSGKTSTISNITDSHADQHSWFWHRYRREMPFAVEGA